MADDILIDEGTGKAIAADDVSSVFYQRIKLDLGGDGLSVPLLAGQLTKAASIPVTLASDEDAIAITVASLPLPTGAATAAKQLADGHNVTVDNASIAVTNGGTFATQAAATLQAGTAEFGKLAAGVAEIGNVKNSGTFAVQNTPAAAVVDTNYFQSTFTSADATAAAPVKVKTSAKKIHVTSLIISTDTAMNIQLQSDNGTPVVQMEGVYLADNGGLTLTSVDKTLPLFVLPTNEDLDVIASATGNISVTISGYVV